MPTVTGKIGITNMPLMDTVVGVPDAKRQYLAGQGLHAPEVSDLKALIDTGTQFTHLNERIARKLGLPRIKQGQHRGLGGAWVDSIYGDISLAFLVSQPNGSVMRVVASAATRAAVRDFDHEHFDVLVGMDLLRLWKLEFDGPKGEFVLFLP